jgi:hypothetical protein
MRIFSLNCVQIENDWFIYISNQGNTITLNQTIEITKTVYVQEKLFLGSAAKLIFILKNKKKNEINRNSFVKTNNCISLHKDSSLIIQLDSKPTNNQTVRVLDYDCPSTLSFEDPNIQIQTKFPNDQKCSDSVSSKINNNPNTLSVTFSSTNSCGKSISRATIIGVAVGGFFGILSIVAVVSLIVYFHKRKSQLELNDHLKSVEFEEMRSSYVKK